MDHVAKVTEWLTESAARTWNMIDKKLRRYSRLGKRALRHPGPERQAGIQIIKSAVAAAIAWQISTSIMHAPMPFMAPVSAVVVVNITIYQSLFSALQRVGATVVGVLFAYWLTNMLGLHWWTLLIMVAGAQLIGKWRRFGKQGIQVTITAILILTLASTSSEYATERVLETIIGAAIGFAINALVLPPRHSSTAAEALTALADEIGEVLSSIGDELRKPFSAAQTKRWLIVARELAETLADAEETVDTGLESVQSDVRWMLSGTAIPGTRRFHELVGTERRRFRTAVAALGHVVAQTRSIARTFRDITSATNVGDADTIISDTSGILLPTGLTDTSVTQGTLLASDFRARYGELLEVAGRALQCFEFSDREIIPAPIANAISGVIARKDKPDSVNDSDAEAFIRHVTDGLRRCNALAARFSPEAVGSRYWPVYGSLMVTAERMFRDLNEAGKTL